MGLVYTTITLSNPRDPALKALAVEALVVSGATTLCLPEHVVLQLQLPSIEEREVVTADGKSHVVSYVGPVQVQFENRTCFTGALVLGDSVLMGAVPMEDMDLVVLPREQRVAVNPKSPNIPTAVVKAAEACPTP
jgi:clan AA aspartic protease